MYFNPQPPSGGWRSLPQVALLSQLFQSTTSIRRLTQYQHWLPVERHYFNPQPPSGGWPVFHHLFPVLMDFNPQPPSGGWRCSCGCRCYICVISIHNLHPEVDSKFPQFSHVHLPQYYQISILHQPTISFFHRSKCTFPRYFSDYSVRISRAFYVYRISAPINPIYFFLLFILLELFQG